MYRTQDASMWHRWTKLHIMFVHCTWYISHYSNPLACHYKISLLVWFSCGIINYKRSCESERDRYFEVQEVCRDLHWTQSFMMIRFSFQGNSLLVEIFQSTVITRPMWVLGGCDHSVLGKTTLYKLLMVKVGIKRMGTLMDPQPQKYTFGH
jgi:hypothetical protein